MSSISGISGIAPYAGLVLVSDSSSVPSGAGYGSSTGYLYSAQYQGSEHRAVSDYFTGRVPERGQTETTVELVSKFVV